MRLDKLLMFSEAQEVTVTADSTNILDLLDQGDDLSRTLNLFCRVGTAVTADGAATVTVSVQTCDTADGSYTTLYTTAAIGKASLTAGADAIAPMALPTGLKRYVKLVYTVATGPLTAGTFTAGITPSLDKSL